MNKYRLIKKLGSGTFSDVFKAQSIKTGAYVAIKCLKAPYSNNDEVNKLREIQALKRLANHTHIIKLIEILYDEPTGRLALVFELMEQNLYEAIKGIKNYLPEKKVKFYMYQLLKALDFMHRNGIFHRDIKPENILLKEDHLKLADLGSCKGIYSKPPFTEYISTRWYRAPECLLTDGYYNYKMDMWGVGCVFFEVLSLFPLFPGEHELDQIHKIHNILGTPSEELLQQFKKNSSHIDFNFPYKAGLGISKFLTHVTHEAQDLIDKLLSYNPEDRYSSKQALSHPYFKDLIEQELKMSKMTNNNFGKQNLMMSFNNNDSMSFIKGVDDSNVISIKNTKKVEKASILPEIKVNIILNENVQKYKNSDSDDSDFENNNNNKRNLMTFLKLPPLNKVTNENLIKHNKAGSNYFNSNEFKNSVKHNLSNQSLEININTQYSKKNNGNMKKKVKIIFNFKMYELKKHYVSPYSQKIINNNLKI